MIRLLTISIAGKPAGDLVWDERDPGRGAFRYLESYLDMPDAIPLDPISMPLNMGIMSLKGNSGWGALEGYVPRGWGMDLLGMEDDVAIPEILLRTGSSPIGLITFLEARNDGSAVETTTELYLSDLDAMLKEVASMEAGVSLSAGSLILKSGCMLGGRRPKALVLNAASGVSYVVKFPSSSRGYLVSLEYATMHYADRAGVNIAPVKLITCGDTPILLVERIGTTARHAVSLGSLLPSFIPGKVRYCYRDLLDLVRRLSIDPIADSAELFRRIVFSAVINHSDDQPKRFWMLYGQDGWRLAPAFGLYPDLGGERKEHSLLYGGIGCSPGRKGLELIGRSWGVRGYKKVVEQVFDHQQNNCI